MSDDICEEPPLVWCMQACLTQTVFDVALGLWSTRRLDALLKAAEGLARVPEDNMLSQCAVPLRDAHPGHTLLHSVLSSASLPHYSSSNFKREYALLQLACLELITVNCLDLTIIPLSRFYLPICLRLSISAVFTETNLALEGIDGGGQVGALCIYIWTMRQRRQQQVEILKDI